mmetsp:Transcript_27563/g.42168  ORF Transcript_27563/g.42168 Transcript_27563/m.42168 type:complete len:140 (-) Transcript_27563:2790-3209(-)
MSEDGDFVLNKEEPVGNSSDSDESSFEWTPLAVFQAISLFILAGVAEIGGGWMVWASIRGNKQWWYAVVGSVVLVCYGFIPTLQPTDNFGRVYAVYGGFFILLSFIWGWAIDGDRPDLGDVVGGTIALLGATILLFWPR